MKSYNETRILYISDDGKKRSYDKDEIARYEKKQLKEVFEKRTNVANIATSTTLYLFKKGDIETFKEFHPEAYLDSIDEEEEGYFVYVYDSTYDYIGVSYHLYHQKDYETMVLEKIEHYKKRIEHYKNILDSVTNSIMSRETLQP